jgi:dTMP kinase
MNNVISVSGVDSSGKSTQINNFKNYLEINNIKVTIVWSRGGYTNGLQYMKNLIRQLKPNALPPSGLNVKREQIFSNIKIQKFWLLFAILDLIRLYGINIRLLNFLGYRVICDRYLWDTYIDFKMNFPSINFEKWIIWRLLVLIAIKPYISLILLISPRISLYRSKIKKEPFSENLKARKERYNYYKNLISKNKWQYTINAEQPIEKVWTDIQKIL